MTRKRRYLISAAVLTVCVGIALGVLAMLPLWPGVTKANYDRTAVGMTKAQVISFLGLPSELSPNGRFWGGLHRGRLAPGHERVIWGGDDGAAVIVFDEEDRVTHEAVWVDNDNRESFIDKLRRWLGLPEAPPIF